jgi:CyaY protein
MNDSQYQALVDGVYRRLTDAFEPVDPDVADCEVAGDVVTITFHDGKRCIINTQRPTQQIWLAASSRAWHFSYDDAKRAWLDDKGRGDELFATVARIVKETSGADVVT